MVSQYYRGNLYHNGQQEQIRFQEDTTSSTEGPSSWEGSLVVASDTCHDNGRDGSIEDDPQSHKLLFSEWKNFLVGNGLQHGLNTF